MVVANKEMFEKLPAKWQALIKDRFRKSGKRCIRPYMDEVNEATQSAVNKHGMKMLTVSPETIRYLEEKAPEYWNIWRKKAGPYGNEILDKVITLIKNHP